MTDVWVVLKRIEELESSLSKFYEWLEELFSHKEDASLAFTHLSMEEAGHRDLVKYQTRVISCNPALFPAVDIDLGAIDGALDSIRKFRKSASPTLDDALRLSIEIESNLAEDYFNTVVKQSNPQFAHLIDTLSKGSKKHHERLTGLARRHRVALSQDEKRGDGESGTG